MFSAMRLPRLPVLLLVVGLLGAALVAGCSSKEVRYPEDHARFAKIDKAVEELRSAYVRRDLSDIQSLMLPREALEKATNDIQQDFQTYEEITLDWTIDRIVIEGESIEVVVNWAGQWRKNPADTGTRERGQGILKLTGEKTVLLNGLEGDLPFGMALRRAGEPAPGADARPR
jgi:NAD(P)-dependent dehydrogenase (short-subunit alcohol dehydrogenase family)